MSQHKAALIPHNEPYVLWRTDGPYDIDGNAWSDDNLNGFYKVAVLPAAEFMNTKRGAKVTTKDIDQCLERVLTNLTDAHKGPRIGDILTYGKDRVKWAALCLPYSAPDYDNEVVPLPGGLDKLVIISVK